MMIWSKCYHFVFFDTCRGSLGQNLYLKSLSYTSATYATAIFNLIPGITFIVAVILGYTYLPILNATFLHKVFRSISSFLMRIIVCIVVGLGWRSWVWTQQQAKERRWGQCLALAGRCSSPFTKDRNFIYGVLIFTYCIKHHQARS